MKYNNSILEQAVKSKGYKWFNTGDYNLNIVGIRNSDTKNKVTNAFDDTITVSYKIGRKWQYHEFDCTTDPGTHWVENILKASGVAILKPGQYRGSHKIGLHQGKYEALRQMKPVHVYRDKNKDGVYDKNENNVEIGLFGINIHRATKHAGKKSKQIDKWSAGCQVIAAADDFKKLMELANTARTVWSNSFTYTLIESKDIKVNKKKSA
tara:strand:- start:3 stop:629 length:627 start_codon:yes stop_codon:yes gene_type:complete